VPYGDSKCLKLPEGADEIEDDYVMPAYIFPTDWHATELAGVMPGESVVIYGAGPGRTHGRPLGSDQGRGPHHDCGPAFRSTGISGAMRCYRHL